MRAEAQTGKLQIAIRRLLGRYPLLGGLVATWELQPLAAGTMAIGMNDRGFSLYFNPAFTEPLPMEQVVGLLHHEARHVLFGHCLMNPDDYPDATALTIAQEVTANEGLPEPLPDGAVLLKDYPILKPDEDTDTRYRRLAVRKQKKTGAGDGRGHALGDHGCWQTVRDQEELARILIEAALQNAMDGQDAIAEYEADCVEQAYERWGMDSRNLLARFDPSRCPQGVDWRTLLRRYVGRELERRPSYARPPRRFPGLLGVVPGMTRTSARPRILAIIDTSGSITDEMLADISAELTHMARRGEVFVVECDLEIHEVYRYTKPVVEVNGGGGTDLCPPLEPVFLRKTGADVVIYFTDGYGPAPEQKPQVTVIWCLTPDGDPPAPWGKVVRMG